jgi:hypothetical protein
VCVCVLGGGGGEENRHAHSRSHLRLHTHAPHSCAHSNTLALACTPVQGKTGLPLPDDVAARLLIEGKV